jgi:hypothetical protein
MSLCCPDWQIHERIHTLNGRNLLSLADTPFHRDFITSVFKKEFGISGHLIRKRRPHPIDFTVARAGLGFDPAQRARQGLPDEVILQG